METPSKYLQKIVNEINYDEDELKIYWGDDRYIMGFHSPTMVNLNKYFSIKTIYDTIVDIDRKIKYSFKPPFRLSPTQIVMKKGVYNLYHLAIISLRRRYTTKHGEVSRRLLLFLA